TVAVLRASTSTDSGSNVTSHPLGGEAENVTPVRGAEPLLTSTSGRRVWPPAVPSALSRSSGVVSAMSTVPVTWAANSAVASRPPPETVSTIGYVPAVTSSGGSAVTLMVAVPPPSTVTVVARCSAVGWAETSHPGGPTTDSANVVSPG